MVLALRKSLRMSEFLSPGHIDNLIRLVTEHGTGWILLFVFVSMFVENVFPPYPGDAVIFAAGFISGSGKMSVVPLLILSMIGSISSIMLLHHIGRRYGRVVFESRRLKFLKPEALPRIETWFEKYGDTLLVASRFLAGTRALVAFSAGVGRISYPRMAVLSGISVIMWNSLIILSAYFLKSNWEAVYNILMTYNRVIFAVVILAICTFIIFKIVRRVRSK